MDRAWVRRVQQLQYKTPSRVLAALRELEPHVVASKLPQATKQLRTNDLKRYREMREGALFCYGMSVRLGLDVRLAMDESHDYDFVASWKAEAKQFFVPVQLKEAVPVELNPRSSLQSTVNGLSKYVDSDDLTVAIYLNQQTRFVPEDLVVPQLKLASLWVFGAISPDAEKWALWGDFMLPQPFGTLYTQPAA